VGAGREGEERKREGRAGGRREGGRNGGSDTAKKE